MPTMSNVQHIRHAACAALAGALLAGPVSAQSYYARERVIGAGELSPDAGATWHSGEWSASSSTCSNASQQVRAVSCQRPNGIVTTDAACDPGTRPSSSQTVPDLSGCEYGRGAVVAYGPWNSTCSATAHRSEQHGCLRSDGTVVPDGECTIRGIVLTTQSVPTTNYSGCSFAWQTGSWSAYSSTCSASATRTRAVSCQRSDGSTVNDSYCASVAAKPDAAETNAQYSGCSYTPTYSASYNSCSPSSSGSAAGTQSAALVSCVRSDNVDVTVANANTGYANCAASITRPCTVSYVGTYTWGTCGPSSQGAMTGSQAGTIASCHTSDGTTAPIGACSSTSSRACTIESYSQTYSSYGACSGGSQSAPIATCKTTAATGEVGAVSSGLCPANTQALTRSCTASSCGSFSNNRWVVSGGVVPNGRIFVSNTTVAEALVSARSHCQSLPGVAQCELSWDPDNVRGRMTITAYGSGTQGVPNNGYSYQSAVCTGG